MCFSMTAGPTKSENLLLSMAGPLFGLHSGEVHNDTQLLFPPCNVSAPFSGLSGLTPKSVSGTLNEGSGSTTNISNTNTTSPSLDTTPPTTSDSSSSQSFSSLSQSQSQSQSQSFWSLSQSK